MTTEPAQESPQPPAAAFTWNAGGWFGAQLGGSVWMLVSALVLLPADWKTGVAVLAAFVLVNVIGLWMWSRRSRYRSYPCIQLLIAILGAAGFFAVAFIDGAGQWHRLQFGGQTSVRSMYVMLAILIPGLMLLFHTIHRAGKRGQR